MIRKNLHVLIFIAECGFMWFNCRMWVLNTLPTVLVNLFDSSKRRHVMRRTKKGTTREGYKYLNHSLYLINSINDI